MKFITLLLVSFTVFSYNAASQTLYVPSGTSGIGSSSTANVGIGTANPSGKFGVINGQVHINSTGTGSTTIDDASTALVVGPKSQRIPTVGLYYPGIAFNHLLNYSGTTYNSANHAWIGLRLAALPGSEQSDLVFATKEGTDNNSRPIERMCIKYNGNVGIGGTPYAKLHVYAEGDPELAEFDSRNGFQIWGTDQAMYMGVCTNKRVSYIQSVDKGTSESTLALNVRGGAVTIGTINANGYQFAVNGGILCENVKVIIDVPNSDYVFESDYNLRSLEEIEHFVNENKHLPEVPSSSEFKENGYSLGNMDDILLRKVEELTLYIIEQNKRIKALEAENEKMKSK